MTDGTELWRLGLADRGGVHGPGDDAVLKRFVYPGIGVAWYWEEP